jgi:hypothetical protein
MYSTARILSQISHKKYFSSEVIKEDALAAWNKLPFYSTLFVKIDTIKKFQEFSSPKISFRKSVL